SATTQPTSFAGNALLDCDSVGPHNETTIAVNPTNAANIVAASHTYLYNLDKQSAIALLRIFTEAYVSKDGGQSWTNVHPPHGSYRFLTDPALAFDGDGHLYWSNVASHDSVAGAFSDVSVIVERSDDGGITWNDPVTVAKGNGTISNGGSNVLFNDKDWIAVDRGTSRYRGSVYVTWARQQYRKDVQTESPIFFVRSRDGGATWTSGAEISGSSRLCSGQGVAGPTTRCDQNDAGFSSPIVAPDGTIYVAFLNHQAQGTSLRDQVLLVRSVDAGAREEQQVRPDLSLGRGRCRRKGAHRVRGPRPDRTRRSVLRLRLHARDGERPWSEQLRHQARRHWYKRRLGGSLVHKLSRDRKLQHPFHRRLHEHHD